MNENDFGQNLSEENKELLKKAFMSYIADSNEFYTGKKLDIVVEEIEGNYLKGRMLVVGIENFSAPYFLAVKIGKDWKVVYNGQDVPLCSQVESYDFSKAMVPNCAK